MHQTYIYIHTYILFVFKIEIRYFNMPAGSYANLGELSFQEIRTHECGNAERQQKCLFATKECDKHAVNKYNRVCSLASGLAYVKSDLLPWPKGL